MVVAEVQGAKSGYGKQLGLLIYCDVGSVIGCCSNFYHHLKSSVQIQNISFLKKGYCFARSVHHCRMDCNSSLL